MRKNGARNGNRKPGGNRQVSFEPLGTRIALAAGGMGAIFHDLRPLSDAHETAGQHARMLGSRGEFSTLQQAEWQRASGALNLHGAGEPGSSDGPSVRQMQYSVGAGEFGGQPIAKAWGSADRQLMETRVVPASVQVSGTNLVLPGLLVAHGDALTLVIATSPVYGLPVGSQYFGKSEGRESFNMDRELGSKPPAELAMPQVAIAGDGDHGDRPSGAGSANAAPSGTQAAPPRGGDMPSFVAPTVEARDASVRVSGGWVGKDTSRTEADARPTPVESRPVTGQWAISKTDLEDGLIELESPLGPRRKGRKLPGDTTDESGGEDAWVELRSFAERMWSAWNEAWREFGEDAKQPADDAAEAAAIAEQSVGQFDANVIDGLVELGIDGAMPIDRMPGHDRGQVAADGPVRIDAGVALFQQFEVATAADGAPPALDRTADRELERTVEGTVERKAKSDEHAEAEMPAEAQPVSAAAVGVGVVIGVPYSLRKRRDEDDDERQPRLRTV